jgi:glycerol uptake facilitator-like aquaporin
VQQSAFSLGSQQGACCSLEQQTEAVANPAISVGRMFSNTFVGIAPASVPAFIAAQLVGRTPEPRCRLNAC